MAARRQASPEQVEGSLDPGMQRGVAVQRPDQKRSEDGLAKYLGDLRGWQVAADFATVLTKLDHLGVQSMNRSEERRVGKECRSRRWREYVEVKDEDEDLAGGA